MYDEKVDYEEIGFIEEKITGIVRAELPEDNVEVVMKILGGKWKILIVRNLLERAWRFNELKRNLGVSQKALTDALRELEDAGLVSRTVYAEIPPKVEYELTEVGMTLKPLIRAMKKWGGAYKQKRVDVAPEE